MIDGRLLLDVKEFRGPAMRIPLFLVGVDRRCIDLQGRR
jgi:hypothetical protein